VSRWLQLALPPSERVTDPCDKSDKSEKRYESKFFQRLSSPEEVCERSDKCDESPPPAASIVPNGSKEPLPLNLTKPEIPKPPRFSVGGRPMTATGQIMSWDEWNRIYMKGERKRSTKDTSGRLASTPEH